MPNKKHPNYSEKRMIEYLALLDGELGRSEDILKARLRSSPDAWRQFRIARTALSKALDGLYDTLPVKHLKQLLRFLDRSKIYIQLDKASPPPEYEIVQSDILIDLIRRACEAECATCLRPPVEMLACDLHKELLQIAPPAEGVSSENWCPYVGVRFDMEGVNDEDH